MYKFLLLIILVVSCSTNEVNVEKLERYPIEHINVFRSIDVEYDDSFSNKETLIYLENRIEKDSASLKNETVSFPAAEFIKINKFDAFLAIYSYIALRENLACKAKQFISERIKENPSNLMLQIYATYLVDFYKLRSKEAFTEIGHPFFEEANPHLKEIINRLIKTGTYKSKDQGLKIIDF